MAVLETLKNVAEKATGLARPSGDQIEKLIRSRKANTFRFKDDGVIPNHAHWPFVFYRGVVALPDDLDPAAIMEELFELNGWGDSWRNGIYDYVHYHSRIHEVLGIAKGKGTVRFGGNNGRTVHIKAGDVAILPAGTGHQCLFASSDFLVVGAYPPSGTYDECTKSEDHRKALKTKSRAATQGSRLRRQGSAYVGVDVRQITTTFGMDQFKVPDRGSANPTPLGGLGRRHFAA